MSKDIRSYFTFTSKTKPQSDSRQTSSVKRKISSVEDDDDVIPPTPPPNKESKDKKKKRKLVVESDSDDSEDNFVKSKKAQVTKQSPKKEKEKKRLKEVKPSDVFGNAPIQRTIIPKKSSDIKKESKKVVTEVEIHSDDSFDKTLLELDEEKEIKSAILEKDVGNDHADKSFSPSNKSKDVKMNTNENKKLKTPVKDANNDVSKGKSPLKENRKDQESLKSKSKYELNGKTQNSSAKPEPVSSKSSSQKPKSKPHKDKKDFSLFLNKDNEDEVDDKKTEKSETSETNKKSDTSPKISPEKEKKSRKRKISDGDEEKTPEELDAERFEKKRHSALLYKNYLNRSGPKHHGSKEIPEGSPNCLKGFSFVTTGVLDSFEREEVEEAIKRYGGEIKKGVSGKVTHIICGDDAGPAKIAKAEKLGISILDEDGFLDLIRNKSKTNEKSHRDVDTNPKKSEEVISKSSNKTPKKNKENGIKDVGENNKISAKKNKEDSIKSKDSVKNGENSKNSPKKKPTLENLKKSDMNGTKTINNSSDIKSEYIETKNTSPVKTEESSENKALLNQSWVDKYRPTTMKQIIGQHGDNSCANKLHNWLSKWYKNRKAKLPPPNPWSKGDGGYYKAVLLSGPPGVGKTTTVSVVCKELGFDTVEFNASDTRSKNLIKEQITEITSTNSLLGFVQGKSGKGAVSKKHAIIMDEVDGMAGNEDRGGMQELINLIKTTEVPIICICNDKSSPKMRSLINYCFDIAFAKPRVEQIKAAMMSICFKEGVKISPNSLGEIIMGASQDIRQILNLLSMWSSAEKNISSETASDGSKAAKKDIKMGPWAVCRSVFSHEEHKTMSIHDKSDLFFHDYSLGPLFVQHNYLKVVPKCPNSEILSRFAEAADSLSIGDLVESKIRRNMAWSLLPTQAMYSSVIPGTVLSGNIQGQIDFPGWLGQNSRTNKMNRLAQEINSHTRLSTTGSRLSIRLDYASHILNAALDPLINEGVEGVPKTINILEEYHLLKDDINSLIELSKWPGQNDKNSLIEAKVKSALTRKYNKEAAPLPYSLVNVKKSASSLSKDSGYDDDVNTEDQDQVVDEDEDSDIDTDAMIKTTKTKSSTAKEENNKPSKSTTGKSKGKTAKGQSGKKSKNSH